MSKASNSIPKKVLLLVSTSSFAGVERFVVELSKSLQKTRYIPIIGIIRNRHNPSDALQVAAQESHLQKHVFESDGRFDVRLSPRLQLFIREHKIDLIHSHQYKANFMAVLVANKTATPIITTCHLYDHNKRNLKLKAYYWIDKLLLSRFDYVAATSEEIKTEILKRSPRGMGVTVVNNGVDMNRFQRLNKRESLRTSLGIKPDSTVVGMVARLDKQKNHSLLLNSAVQILERFPNTVFLVIGDGPLKDRLKQQSINLNIERHVLFTGARNDIPALLSVMNIFVLPSLDEGLPLAMLEAMAALLPVVVTPVGSIPKVVQHDYSGLIIENNPRSLSDAILSLLTDPQKAARLAENGYNVVKEHFTNERMARAYVHIYDEVLRNGD